MQTPFANAHPSDHADVRTVIDQWLAVVDERLPERRAHLLNQHLAAAAAYPRLTDHDDEGWHLHYRDADQALPHVLEAVISVGTALYLTTRGMARLHRCDAGSSPARRRTTRTMGGQGVPRRSSSAAIRAMSNAQWGWVG
jgi:hypothetical protein